MEEKTLFKLARAITDTGTDTVSSKSGTITYRITSLKRKLVNGKVVSTSTPSCTLGSVSVASVGTLENHYMLSLTALSNNNTGANRSGHIFLTCGDANLSIPVTQEPGSQIECTTGDKVAVYTKPGATWISEGSFIVPSAGGTVSI